MYELLLISQSPRRRQILEDAGFLFRVNTVKISEIIEENVNLPLAIANLAKTKAEVYLESNKHLKTQKILVLAADTVVVIDGRIFGKPQNPTEAQVFLSQLSDREHQVITGFALLNLFTGEKILDAVTTKVCFRKLDQGEISTYVEGGEPMDKAGAYGIQGGGQNFVKKIEGSFLNVVGLPLERFKEVLVENKWQVAQRKN